MVTERGDREPCRAAETFFVLFPDRNLLYRHGYIFPLETTVGPFLYRIIDPAVTDPSRIIFFGGWVGVSCSQIAKNYAANGGRKKEKKNQRRTSKEDI